MLQQISRNSFNFKFRGKMVQMLYNENIQILDHLRCYLRKLLKLLLMASDIGISRSLF